MKYRLSGSVCKRNHGSILGFQGDGGAVPSGFSGFFGPMPNIVRVYIVHAMLAIRGTKCYYVFTLQSASRLGGPPNIVRRIRRYESYHYHQRARSHCDQCYG